MVNLRLLCWSSSFAKEGIMRASHSQIYSLISNTEKYPTFIPWCNSATIVQKISDTHNRTQLCISFGKFSSLKYTSDVYCYPSSANNSHSIIHSICKQDPLQTLDSLWEIQDKGEFSWVKYKLQFEFKSPIYQMGSSLVIKYLGQAMWELFKREGEKGRKKVYQINKIIKEQKQQNLKQFLQKYGDIKDMFEKNREFRTYMELTHDRLKQQSQYQTKMLFQARNWLVHH